MGVLLLVDRSMSVIKAGTDFAACSGLKWQQGQCLLQKDLLNFG